MNTTEKTLLFLTVLFLPTQLGKHFWPKESFIFSLKIDYFSPTIYFWDILAAALLVIFLVRKPKINNTALTILLFFLLSQVISLFFAANLVSGLVRFEQLTIVSLFGFYLASQDLNSIKSIIRNSLTLGVLFEGFLAVSQFISGKSIGLWILGERSFSITTPSIANFNWYGQIFLRPYGTFSHPNIMAAFMVLAIPIIISLSKKKNLPLVVIGYIATFLSFSRTAIMILIIQIILIFKTKFKLLLILLTVFLPFLITRFSSVLNFDKLSITRREDLTAAALVYFLNSPIFGVGLNNFIQVITQLNPVSGPNRFLQPVHNIFLLTLVETGIIGFIGFCLFVFFPVYKPWLKKNKNNGFTKTLLFCWCSMLFLGLFDHYFLTLPQGQRLLFLIWGLSMSSSALFVKIKK